MRSIVVAWLVFQASLFATVSQAADDLGVQVRRNVRGLNAAELTVRDQAEKAIVDLGPAALPLLPADDPRMPAEVVDRLNRIRQVLLKKQVQDQAQASRITIDVKDAPLADVLAEFSKQSGNRIIDHRDAFGGEAAPIKVTFACDKLPFWEALDKVLDQSKLDVYNYGGERGVYVINRPAGRLPRSERVSYSGPFRVSPARFEAVVDLQNPRNRSLKLFLEVSWEPRLRPINIVQPLSTVQATAGETVIPVDGNEGEPEVSVGPASTTVELQVLLQGPPRSVEKIATLKGMLKALVPGPAEEFRFTPLVVAKAGPEGKRTDQRRAAVVVSVEPSRRNNDVWEVPVRVKFDNPGEALDSYRSWIYDNEAYLEDAGGKRIAPGGFEQTRQTKDEVGVKYLFDEPESLAGVTLVYKTPLAILPLPIEYELHDLPLP